jgi:hypothetical protein
MARGRKPIHEQAMSPSERQRRRREKLVREHTPFDLTVSPEVLRARMVSASDLRQPFDLGERLAPHLTEAGDEP